MMNMLHKGARLLSTARLRCLISLLLLLLASVSDAVATPIRIISWNVEWFPGRYPDATPRQKRQHIDEVKMTLRRLKPDVLVLVEVRDPESVRKAISVLPGFHLNVISDFEGRPQQIAIASRFPLSRGGTAPWIKVFAGPPRGFVFAELRLPDDKCLQVIGVHWKSNRGLQPLNYAFREISAVQLRGFLDMLNTDTPHCPEHGTIVAGDMNTALDAERFSTDDSLRYLIGSGMNWPFLHVAPADRLTWHGDSFHEPVQFDHFLTENVGSPTARVLKAGLISDHSPIELVIDTADIAEESAPAPATARP